MIALTKKSGEQVYVNPELLLFVEETPDTLLTFHNGQRLLVQETGKEVVARAIAYARSIRQPAGRV